jgi:hypothetical protein
VRQVYGAATLMVLGLLVGAGCASTSVEDAGGSGTTSGDGTTGGQDAGMDAGHDAGPDAGPVDAGDGGPDAGYAPDLSCSGISPTTAPATLNLGGFVGQTDLSGTSGVAGANVEFFASSGGAALATTTTASNGAFSVSVPSGGVPLDGYFHVSDNSVHVDTYWYPPVPFYEDSSTLPIALFTTATLGLLEFYSSATHQPGTGRNGLEVVDCARIPISGATVTSTPAAGKTVYIVDGFPIPTASATDFTGTAFLFNLPAGQVTLGGTLGSTTLRSHSIEVRQDVVTESSVVP